MEVNILFPLAARGLSLARRDEVSHDCLSLMSLITSCSSNARCLAMLFRGVTTSFFSFFFVSIRLHQNEYVFTLFPFLSLMTLNILFTPTYVSNPTGPKNMHPKMHGTTAMCGMPTRLESARKNRAVN